MKKIITSMLALGVCAAIPCHTSSAPWMESLADGVYVHQLSIPGTHDSGTGDGVSLSSFALTQDLGIGQQFDAGIRAFDLRPALKDSKLHIYHGIARTKISFDEAITTMLERLDANPSEFVIVVMRHESDTESDKERAGWAAAMNEYLNDPARSSRIVNFRPDLTLGDVRGKIVLLSRDNYGPTPVGGYISGWGHSADFIDQTRGVITGPTASGTLWVQDYYDTYDALDKKVEAITYMLDKSAAFANSKAHTWVINHTSGYSSKPATANGYRTNAATTNAAVISWLSDPANPVGPTGLVMMDYAGVDRSGNKDVMGLSLINAIIDHNNSYIMRTDPSSAPVTKSDPEVTYTDGIITCPGMLHLYNAAGMLVASSNETVSVSTPGLYILHSSTGTTHKVMVR